MAAVPTVRALAVGVLLDAAAGWGVHELLARPGAGGPPTPMMFVLLFAGLGAVSVLSDVVIRGGRRHE